MYAENSEALTGNARFEGYSIDLIQHISEILGTVPELREMGGKILFYTGFVLRFQLHHPPGCRPLSRKLQQTDQEVERHDWRTAGGGESVSSSDRKRKRRRMLQPLSFDEKGKRLNFPPFLCPITRHEISPFFFPL